MGGKGIKPASGTNPTTGRNSQKSALYEFSIRKNHKSDFPEFLPGVKTRDSLMCDQVFLCMCVMACVFVKCTYTYVWVCMYMYIRKYECTYIYI